MRRARVRSWGVFGLLTCALGCAGPAAVPKRVGAPTPAVRTVTEPADRSRARPELDSEQPEYWATHVGEPKRFKELFERLSAFLSPEDNCCHVVDADDSAGREQARLRGSRVAGPLTQSYLAHARELDAKSRARLLRLLVKTHDPRVESAVRFALSEHLAGREGMDPNELRAAVRGVRELRLESCRDLLLSTYLTVHRTSRLGQGVWHDLPFAMIDVADASWLAALSQKLSEPLVPGHLEVVLNEDELDAGTEAYLDQLFWQATAAQVLGHLRVPSSVDVLANVLLDPAKKDVHDDARLALLGIGRPAFERGLALLRDADERRMRVGALLVGGLGLADGTAPLLQALARAKDPVTRASLALELPRLPASAATRDALRRVFETTPPATSLNGNPSEPLDALDALADAAVSFQDAALVPWLLLQAERARGNPTARAIHRTHLLFAAIKLATPLQWSSVSKAVAKLGGEGERSFAEPAGRALLDCRDDLDCYRRLVTAAAVPESDGRFVGIKAAHRIAQLGNPQAAESLSLLLRGMRDPPLAVTIARVIDHLLPQGSAAAEKELTKLFEDEGHSWRSDAAPYVEDTLYRLRARSPASVSPP